MEDTHPDNANAPMTAEQRQAMWDEMTAARKGDEQPAAQAQEAAAPAPAAAPEQPAAPPPKTLADIEHEFNQKMAAMERRVRNAEGHAGSAREDAKKARTELEAQRQRLANAEPTPDQIKDAGKSGAKWDALKTDFPEWGEAIEERFGTGGAKGDQEAIRRLEQTAAADRATADAERKQLAQELQAARRDTVESHHPRWEDTCRTPEFSAWLEKAGAEARELAQSPLASDAVKLLNRFKYGADTAPGQHLPNGRTAADLSREREERLSTAVTPRRSTAGSPSAKSEQDMTAEEYWQYLRAKKQQQGAR
jgi:hypothetical protein